MKSIYAYIGNCDKLSQLFQIKNAEGKNPLEIGHVKENWNSFLNDQIVARNLKIKEEEEKKQRKITENALYREAACASSLEEFKKVYLKGMSQGIDITKLIVPFSQGAGSTNYTLLGLILKQFCIQSYMHYFGGSRMGSSHEVTPNMVPVKTL